MLCRNLNDARTPEEEKFFFHHLLLVRLMRFANEPNDHFEYRALELRFIPNIERNSIGWKCYFVILLFEEHENKLKQRRSDDKHSAHLLRAPPTLATRIKSKQKTKIISNKFVNPIFVFRKKSKKPSPNKVSHLLNRI